MITGMNFWIWDVLITLVIYSLLQSYSLRKLKKNHNKLKGLIEQNIKLRNALYENLTDPDKIMDDMERGAVAMEALIAERRTMVRPDAGPHARIYRPNVRSSLPGQLRKQADSGSFGASDKE